MNFPSAGRMTLPESVIGLPSVSMEAYVPANSMADIPFPQSINCCTTAFILVEDARMGAGKASSGFCGISDACANSSRCASLHCILPMSVVCCDITWKVPSPPSMEVKSTKWTLWL